VVGCDIFDGAGRKSLQPSNLESRGGFAAIADFNGDGRPDLVCVQPGPASVVIGVFDIVGNTRIFGPRTIEFDGSAGVGGPPTIDDFDGDGIPDIAVAGDREFCVYSLRCEVVYRDECWLRIYDGMTGRTLSDRTMTSATFIENPVMWLRVNDAGAGGMVQPECKTWNDVLFMPGVVCKRPS
jgi:hypothetical protein